MHRQPVRDAVAPISVSGRAERDADPGVVRSGAAAATTNTCRICRRSEDHPRFHVREMMFGFRDAFTYFECTGCGCVQIEAVPDDIGRYYPNRYYSFQRSTRIAAFLKKQRARHAFHHTGLIGAAMAWCLGPQPAIESVRRLAPRLDAAILDVGSGGGELLGFLAAIGFTNLTGVDPFLERDDMTPSGIRLLKRDLAQIDEQFDVVMLHHVFEHTVDPRRVFSEIKRVLKPGGAAILRVPVADSYAWRTYGINWVALDPPRHVFVPTVRSMAILSAEHGLRLGQVTHDANEFQFWGSEQYIREIPLVDPRSYARPRHRWKLALPTRTMRTYRARAAELNANGQGDSACFCFHHD